MKKTVISVLLCCVALLALVAMTACSSCEHSYDNDCDATCNGCGELREVGAHDYADATCTAAKTCKLCGVTEGEALGHAANEDDGECTTAVTCGRCGQTVIEAKAHSGGTQSCKGYQCAACGTWYGEPAADAHFSNEFIYTDNGDGTHAKKHACCNAVAAAAEDHDLPSDACACGATVKLTGVTFRAEEGFSVSEGYEQDTDTYVILISADGMPGAFVNIELVGENLAYLPDEDETLQYKLSSEMMGDLQDTVSSLKDAESGKYVLQYFLTEGGPITVAYSVDGGETWSDAVKAEVRYAE